MLGKPVTTSLDPQTGEGFGNCGERNLDLRAVENNVVAYAASADYLTTEGGIAGVSLYSFGTEEDAKGLLALTVSQSNCPDGVEYEMEEGEDGDGQVDYFAGESSIGAVWTVLDGVSVASAAGGDADEAFFVTRELQSSIHFQDLDYGFLDSAILIYERHGRLVMVYRVWGRCCHYGFNNEYLGVYTPTFDEASTSLEILRPHVLNSLPDK